MTDRFTRAVDQLGSKQQLATRLGGIYALEQIMRESETHFAPIVELLSALVRTKADSTIDGSTNATTGLREDVIAALEVLQRNNRPSVAAIDLTGGHLVGARLKSADLRHAKLSGADLRRCDLTAANLRDASLASAIVR